MSDHDLILVTLRPDGPGPPVEVRLKRWLKTALRTWGLRCVRVEVSAPRRDDEAAATEVKISDR